MPTGMADASVEIRPATIADEAAFFRICLLTANSGGDGSRLYSEPKLPGYVWSVPYLHTELALAFVLARGEGVLGYVVGAQDTVAFEDWQRQVWWPRVAAELTDFAPRTEDDRQIAAMVRNPPDYVPQFVRDYPAHLHINLLPSARSGGWGRRMIETLCLGLKRRGAAALHLGVSRANTNAIGFYEHLGFAEVAPDDEDPGGVIMGMRL